MRRRYRGVRTPDHQEPLHEELEQIWAALHQMASEARGSSPRAPSPGTPPTDRNVQVIVEIETKAATGSPCPRISERQEWTFGETLLGQAPRRARTGAGKNGDRLNLSPSSTTGASFRAGPTSRAAHAPQVARARAGRGATASPGNAARRALEAGAQIIDRQGP